MIFFIAVIDELMAVIKKQNPPTSWPKKRAAPPAILGDGMTPLAVG